MVDALVSLFVERLLEALVNQSRIVFELKDQFEKLKSELQLMQSFLMDADRLKRKHQTLQTIMGSLRELVYEAEDILADCETRSKDEEQFVERCSMCFSPSFSDLPFLYQTGKRLREINQKITDIKGNISSYLGVSFFGQTSTVAEDQNNQISRWSSSIYQHTEVVGLEEDTQKIKEWIFAANHGLLAVGIVGMGGLGKTTTAQSVYNDKEVEDHFEKRMWVSVSQTFTVEQIMRSLLKNLGDGSVTDDKDELLRKIHQYLQGKRYLIVMDDVWSKDYSWWHRVSEGLPRGNGSSVIITTRIEEVARKMGVTEERTHSPKFLSEANSWKLFRKISFADTAGECTHPELESVGKEIVQKCKGLPLAIKAVGGIMLCKSPYLSEWRRIADNFREDLAENDDSVKASLQVSYDELPSSLKSCFLCFSLYPEDSVISKEQLIHWWIGEGFLPVRNGRSALEVGNDCFSGLMNRCLIEAVDKTYNGKIVTCKMHDMVRELAIKLAAEDTFSTSKGLKSRHLALKSDIDHKCFQTNLKLRALLSTPKTGEVNKVASRVAAKFCECQYLRVLDLSKSIFETHLTSLLDHIGSLRHLSYLSLSNTHPLVEVPRSMDQLSNLQILDFSYCQNLKVLPSSITNLRKLIVLDVSHCGSLAYLPKGLGRLSNLQALLGFRPARLDQCKGCRIAELRTLAQLATLDLRLTHGDSIGDDEVDVLSDLQQLQVLTISCFGSLGTDLTQKINKLSPPQQLLELCVKFFPGDMSPSWINPISIPLLRSLSISSGNLVKMNPSFWGSEKNAWKVEALMLEAMSDLQENWTSFQLAMPLLRVISISWCPNLSSFPIEDVGFRGGVWMKERQRQ
ncbi:Disease resistance rpp13-like protein [Thalictrum thalictroides]|uniref:Disease resistance rpp13-like protein n=1 Tax=Thalictrum thalictroides TaxID=46969 RepID=A0A7J6WLV1_THATH|nr:Disease resistance rpp13-like protein [Thalictrum thalictroides]